MPAKTYTYRELQEALKAAGFDPGKIDGIPGPKTEAAIVAFKVSRGLAARPYVGPVTIAELFGGSAEEPKYKPDDAMPPWLNELARHLGEHEVRDNAALRKWLKSDGATLGDPAKFPWCGDCMETAIRLSLPDEWAVTDKRLKANPYWALNWQYFGERAPKLGLGAMLAMKREGGGHIASAVGYDPKLRRIRVRGGNQSNRVSDTWIDEDRVVGGPRKPLTWAHALPPIPIMNSAGAVISTNEA